MSNSWGERRKWCQRAVDLVMQGKDHTVKPHANILLLGDFTTDLLKPYSSWDSTITLLGSTQFVK